MWELESAKVKTTSQYKRLFCSLFICHYWAIILLIFCETRCLPVATVALVWLGQTAMRVILISLILPQYKSAWQHWKSSIFNHQTKDVNHQSWMQWSLCKLQAQWMLRARLMTQLLRHTRSRWMTLFPLFLSKTKFKIYATRYFFDTIWCIPDWSLHSLGWTTGGECQKSAGNCWKIKKNQINLN